MWAFVNSRKFSNGIVLRTLEGLIVGINGAVGVFKGYLLVAGFERLFELIIYIRRKFNRFDYCLQLQLLIPGIHGVRLT